MIQLVLQVEGMDAIEKAYNRASVVVKEKLSIAIQKYLVILESNTKKEAPVNKQGGGGSLRQSIRGKMTGVLSGEVTIKSPYAIYVEMGTRPHEIRYSKPGRDGLYNKRTKQGFGRVVHHPGTKANDFMGRAVADSKTGLEMFIREATDSTLKT